MKRFTQYTVCGLLTALTTLVFLWAGAAMASDDEAAGNNLSFPVIWAEGVPKILPGTAEMTPALTGEWWYWWGTTGTEQDLAPLSCLPDPDNNQFCDDGVTGEATGPAPGEGWVKAYVQKDTNNTWQAQNDDWSDALISVHHIDWGDNLESVDWYTRSQVRAEVVLFQDVATMVEYEMRHVSGWGIDEVHGLAASQENAPIAGPGNQATIYSPCARLTIQKLLVEKDASALDGLSWELGDEASDYQWVGEGLINPPLFSEAVHEAADGPGYYNAEINVKGKIIYGYTWNVRSLNEGPGVYRITFSFDESCGGETLLKTVFAEGVTDILLPAEEEIAAALAEETDGTGGGGEAKIDFANNLTYIDVTILDRRSSGNGGGGNGFGGKK